MNCASYMISVIVECELEIVIKNDRCGKIKKKKNLKSEKKLYYNDFF
jgi:hypothetical protein